MNGPWLPAPRGGALPPVVGVLHLRPLAGAPGYDGRPERVRAAMLRDADALAAGGVQALLLENFGDAPFFPGRVPAATVAQMAWLAGELRRATDLPFGVNVLRNDGQAALAVALAAGGAFIRVNVLCSARVTDQGLVQGIAHDLLRDRVLLGAQEIRILADVDVKHSAPLAPRRLDEEVQELLHRGKADAVVVTGAATGLPPDDVLLRTAREAAGDQPVLVGSGADADNVARFLPFADGFLVGTAFKRGGVVDAEVDAARVKHFLDRLQEACV